MWALWETAICAVFQAAVGALFSVHGRGGVHIGTHGTMTGISTT
jgi:hypothetical protein